MVNVILRAAELAFAAIVAGITGWILSRSSEDTKGLGRFIYTEVIAAITILVALLWLIPFSSSFIHWPFDFFVSVCWFVAFGILVNVSVGHQLHDPKRHSAGFLREYIRANLSHS